MGVLSAVELARLASSGLASTSVIPGVSGELISSILRTYFERSQAARERHTVTDASDPLERRRDEVLGVVAELQGRTSLCTANPALQEKALIALVQEELTALDATSERELSRVEARLNQVDLALKTYEKQVRDRHRARRWAVIVSIASLVALSAFLWFAEVKLGITRNHEVALLGLPVPVLLWSVIGSFAAILYRFSNARDTELTDPLKWLFSRPLTGIVMGTITYLTVRVGLLTMAPQTGTGSVTAPAIASEFLWLLSFIAGFSDRFSDALLRTLAGRFGGPKDGDLVSLEVTSETETRASGGVRLLEYLGKLGQGSTPRVSPENLLVSSGKKPVDAGQPIPSPGSLDLVSREQQTVTVEQVKSDGR